MLICRLQREIERKNRRKKERKKNESNNQLGVWKDPCCSVLWAHNSRPGFQQLSLKREAFVLHGGVIIKRYGTLCSFAVSTTPFCYCHNETAAYCLGLDELCAIVFPMKTFYNHGWNDMVVSLVSLRLLACNVFSMLLSNCIIICLLLNFVKKSTPLQISLFCFAFFNLRGIQSGLFFWFTVFPESSRFCSRLFMFWKYQVKVMNCFLSSRHLSCCTFSKRITKNSDFFPNASLSRVFCRATGRTTKKCQK